MNIAELTNSRIEVISSGREFDEIIKPWDDLWRSCGARAFQSHAWISAWWSTLGNGKDCCLRIGLLWQGPHLQAAIPLAISTRRGLRFLEWAAFTYTDYCDLLAVADCSPHQLIALANRLLKQSGYDIALIGRLREGTPAFSLFSASSSSLGLQTSDRSEETHQVADPYPSGEMWFQAQSKKRRQNYRRALASLQTGGRVRFRLVDDKEELAPLLTRLGEMKRQWLESRGRIAPLFNESATTLRLLADALNAQGRLRMFVLENDNTVVAISVNFIQDQALYAFVTSYDQRYAGGSPGMVLMVDYIRWAFDQGLEGVDFLCGDEPFKDRFSTQTTLLRTVMGARTLKGNIALRLDRLRPRNKASE